LALRTVLLCLKQAVWSLAMAMIIGRARKTLTISSPLRRRVFTRASLCRWLLSAPTAIFFLRLGACMCRLESDRSLSEATSSLTYKEAGVTARLEFAVYGLDLEDLDTYLVWESRAEPLANQVTVVA